MPLNVLPTFDFNTKSASLQKADIRLLALECEITHDFLDSVNGHLPPTRWVADHESHSVCLFAEGIRKVRATGHADDLLEV